MAQNFHYNHNCNSFCITIQLIQQIQKNCLYVNCLFVVSLIYVSFGRCLENTDSPRRLLNCKQRDCKPAEIQTILYKSISFIFEKYAIESKWYNIYQDIFDQHLYSIDQLKSSFLHKNICAPKFDKVNVSYSYFFMATLFHQVAYMAVQ